MAQLDLDKLTKQEILSKKAFSEKYGQGVSVAALDYAIVKGHIDWVQPGREKLIVVTNRTKEYTPNFHPARN